MKTLLAFPEQLRTVMAEEQPRGLKSEAVTQLGESYTSLEREIGQTVMYLPHVTVDGLSPSPFMITHLLHYDLLFFYRLGLKLEMQKFYTVLRLFIPQGLATICALEHELSMATQDMSR